MNIPERLSRHSLSYDDNHLLETKVLPEWKRWMLDYGFNTNMFEHGLDGVLKWSAENEADIRDRYQEYVADQRMRYERTGQ